VRARFRWFALAVGIVLLWGALGPSPRAQEPPSLVQVAQIELPRTSVRVGASGRLRVRAMDVWAEGAVAVVTAGPLVHVIDLAEPSDPQVQTIELDAGLESWDAKIREGFLYVGMQVSTDGRVLQVYDVRDPTAPALVGAFETDEFGGVHNLFVAGRLAFLATVAGGTAPGAEPNWGQVWVLDVSDPAEPTSLGPLQHPDGETPFVHIHDLTVVDGRAYLAGWDTGLWLLALNGLDAPDSFSYALLAQHSYKPFLRTPNAPNPSAHNAWPSSDGRVLWTTDEVVGEGVRAFDVSDPEAIELLDFFSLERRSLPHNVLVDGPLAYVAHYLDGLRVLRLTEGGEIEQVLHYDTVGNQPRTNPFSGAFGVYPFGRHVLVADTFSGLHVLEKRGVLAP